MTAFVCHASDRVCAQFEIAMGIVIVLVLFLVAMETGWIK